MINVWVCVCVIDVVILLISAAMFADELNRGRFHITSLMTFLCVSSIHFRFDHQDFCVYFKQRPWE
jgi:hypothetical protein